MSMILIITSATHIAAYEVLLDFFGQPLAIDLVFCLDVTAVVDEMKQVHDPVCACPQCEQEALDMMRDPWMTEMKQVHEPLPCPCPVCEGMAVLDDFDPDFDLDPETTSTHLAN